eukprot:COSAG02_NODE_8875_length_2412_cov_10.796495_1_plen_68_part_00
MGIRTEVEIPLDIVSIKICTLLDQFIELLPSGVRLTPNEYIRAEYFDWAFSVVIGRVSASPWVRHFF